MRLQKAKLDWDSLGFNLIPTRSMYSAMCCEGENWSNGSLIPFGNIELSPAAVVLNYGQGVFEGTKAFHTSDDRIALFRIDKMQKGLHGQLKDFVSLKLIQNFF